MATANIIPQTSGTVGYGATQNIVPFGASISLSTIDLTTNKSISEGYIVTGPTGINVTPIKLSNTKYVIALSKTSGSGSPYLKIWLPNPTNGNIVSVTYCVANPYMADGYYDYKTGVPASYLTALQNWVTPNTSLINQNKSLKFLAYGSTTNDATAAVTFYINFSFSSLSSTSAVVGTPTGTLQ